MKISPSLIVIIAVILSVASAGVMLTLNYDALFTKPIIKAEFTSESMRMIPVIHLLRHIQ